MSTPPLDPTELLHELVQFRVEGVEVHDPADSLARIQELLDQGADLNKPTIDHQGEAAYPLARAAAEGSAPWTRFLLDLGAKVYVQPEKAAADLPDYPLSPFTPLSLAIEGLGYTLENDHESLMDSATGHVGTIRALLAAGAHPLDPDPYRGDHAFLNWVNTVKEMLSDPPFSQGQVDAVVEVTDLLLDAIEPHVSSDFRQRIINQDSQAKDQEVHKMLSWPSELVDAWASRTVSRQMDSSLGKVAPGPVSLRPGRM